jgi:hypothetical protein
MTALYNATAIGVCGRGWRQADGGFGEEVGPRLSLHQHGSSCALAVAFIAWRLDGPLEIRRIHKLLQLSQNVGVPLGQVLDDPGVVEQLAEMRDG